MKTGLPAHALSLALLLTLAPAAQAGSGWDCAADSDGRWNCVAAGTDSAPARASRVRDVPKPVTQTIAATSDHTRPELLPAPAAGSASQARHAAAEIDTEEPARLCPPAAQPAHLADIENRDLVDLYAQQIDASRERVFTLSGNAVVRYDRQQLEAGNITYDSNSGVLDASGGIRLAGPNIDVSGDRALIQTGDDTGTLEGIEFTVPGRYSRGRAGALTYVGLDRLTLDRAEYTTCPEGKDDWLLSARKIVLDRASGTGVARNAKVTFKDVPLLFTPYISFPLDNRRKTGLLTPLVGTSDETGLDIRVPWYWNIAPNRDLTLTPRFMSDRGVMLISEFRFLNRTGEGSLNLEYLPADKEFNDQDRSLASIKHRGNPTPRLSTRIDVSDVSDDRYFEDFSSSLVQSSQTSLERTAQATWHGDSWQLGVNLQDFQSIDPSLASFDRSYRQLPQVLINVAPERRLLGLQASARAELNYFTHSNNARVTGARIDLVPRISAPVQRPGWYVDPAVAVRHTSYMLDNTAIGDPDRPTRTLPVATLDMGSFFERDGAWGDKPYIQTLEPRLFYLYVPDENQDELPIFDTDNYDQNYDALFRENRFSGPDRMGDANQLAVALTTRLLSPADGRQLFSASIGSLLYFRDRTVVLPGESVATDSSSGLITEVEVALSRRWSGHGEMHWNPHTSTTERSNYQLQYRAAPRSLLNIGYRFRDGLQEQADLSFAWPLGRSWHGVGRWYYSFDNNETIEALAGLSYERCCWTVQVVGRSYINDDSQRRNNAVFIQLELKGLGKLGTNIDDTLERGILGYQSF